MSNKIEIKTIFFLLAPVVLLLGVIALFLKTGGGLNFEIPAPVEVITVERVELSRNHIDIKLRNSSPEAVEIAQVIVNDAVRPFHVEPAVSIPRLNKAVVHLDYGWVTGEAYEIVIFTTNAIAVNVEIPVAFETPKADAGTFWGFALIGIYVGVLPVFLGIFWFPALKKLGRRWMVFLMAATIGLLIFLGLDTLAEALELAAEVPAAFQGIGLIGIGGVATFFLLEAISKRQDAVDRSGEAKRLSIAYLISLGIGLHNLGEGLAIGAAYNIGEASLGTFLVVGFIIQNITEGLGIIAPVLQDRPKIRHLAWLGIIGGAPAILGAWVGGLSPSPTLAVLFLGIGAGAIFQVVYEINKLIQNDTTKQEKSMMVFSGVVSGMLVLWVTGLLIK
ncbi:MAG: metal transporter [Anaerolineae bacterium]|nr:metal transporter [Anaerolineae bacterium]